MPIGVIIDALSVLLGGLVGALLGSKLTDRWKDNLNMVLGGCAMTMGITSIILMKNMPAVVLSVILGTVIGIAVGFEKWVVKLGKLLQMAIGKVLPQKGRSIPQAEFDQQLLTAIVLFCASGTGIYGAIVAGMNGDHSILISKAILDFFTALIMACALGATVSFVAIPQFMVLMLLFLCGGFILPYTTPNMINDFKAVGGVLLLATGFRMIKVKMFPTADMIPAMILAMPASWFWMTVVLPVLP